MRTTCDAPRVGAGHPAPGASSFALARACVVGYATCVEPRTDRTASTGLRRYEHARIGEHLTEEVSVEDHREPLGLGERGRDDRSVARERRHHLLSADRASKFPAGAGWPRQAALSS